MNLLIFRPEMGTRSRGQEQTWVKKERMLVVDFSNSVTFAALTQNYKRKNKPVHNKSGSITTVYLCNYARKLGYSFGRLIFVWKLNLTNSPLFVYKFAVKVHNMNSYQYRNEWMAAFNVAESYENIYKFSQILATNLFTQV